MSTAAAMLLALGLDALIGWPGWLHARIGHPVTWIGAFVAALDARLNRPAWPDGTRRLAGLAAALAVIGAAAGVAALAPGNALVAGILAWPLVAARSLDDHVRLVARRLGESDLPGARVAVSHIVGRDPARLDASGVSRAALESLSENASDAVVAPVFWGVLLGLPGIAGYKAVNTLDSMIGHRTPRHEAFGWAAARIDDVANLVPARLTALLVALASGRPRAALGVMWRDAARHLSPNAGWPELAIAGALEVRLSGPRVYGERLADEPWLNAGAPDPTAGDVRRGLALYRRTLLLLAVALTLLAVL